LVALLALIAMFPHTARAQSGVDGSPAGAPASRPIAVWASVGLGGGGIHEPDNGAIGGVLAAHASREGWAAFRRLPLREDELARIAGNVAPSLR
jgi:hypothetical protein